MYGRIENGGILSMGWTSFAPNYPATKAGHRRNSPRSCPRSSRGHETPTRWVRFEHVCGNWGWSPMTAYRRPSWICWRPIRPSSQAFFGTEQGRRRTIKSRAATSGSAFCFCNRSKGNLDWLRPSRTTDLRSESRHTSAGRLIDPLCQFQVQDIGLESTKGPTPIFRSLEMILRSILETRHPSTLRRGDSTVPDRDTHPSVMRQLLQNNQIDTLAPRQEQISARELMIDQRLVSAPCALMIGAIGSRPS